MPKPTCRLGALARDPLADLDYRLSAAVHTHRFENHGHMILHRWLGDVEHPATCCSCPARPARALRSGAQSTHEEQQYPRGAKNKRSSLQLKRLSGYGAACYLSSILRLRAAGSLIAGKLIE